MTKNPTKKSTDDTPVEGPEGTALDAARQAEATDDKHVTFTVTVAGIDLEITTVRDPIHLPRRAVVLLGRQDPVAMSQMTEYLLGPKQLAKVDALDPTIEDFANIALTWLDEVGATEK